MDKWSVIPLFGDKYEISADGQVRNKNNGRVLKQHINNGYFKVGLVNCVNFTFPKAVHRLMALAFFGDPPKDYSGYTYVVNHKDGNKLNNTLENLEYVSTWENTTHYHQVLKNR